MSTSITTPSEIFYPQYLRLQDLLDQSEKQHWNIFEPDMRQDTEQWKNGSISDSEKAYIKHILRLFTQLDTNVCSSYVERLLPIFKHPDARMMLLSFAAREVTHMKGYKLLNDTLGYDTEEFTKEFLTYKEMKDKHIFMIEDVPTSTPANIATLLARQILMEGVNLFGSFIMLLSWSQVGKLPGMISVNKWSILDESTHVEGLTEMFRLYLHEHPEVINNPFKANIYETARTVVGLEDSFIDMCYRIGTNPALTAEQAKAYVRYVCDYRMVQMGLKPQFGVKDNPTPWIDHVTDNALVNFFEATNTEYAKGAMVGDWEYPSGW